jgi:ankyrin repeat protein
MQGEGSTVEALLKRGADPAATDDRGMTPLHIAAWEGYAQHVRLLLSHGSPVEAKDQHGYRALHEAAFTGRLEVVNILVEAGADVNANAGGWTPALCARMKGHDVVAKYLAARGGRE